MTNLEKEMERIKKKLESLESFLLWNAFTRDPDVEKFWEEDTLIRFCQDAYELLEGHDELYTIDDEHLFEDSIDWMITNYKELLQIYDYPADDVDEAVDKMLYCYYAGWPSICENIAKYYGYNDDDIEIDEDDKWNTTIANAIIGIKTSAEAKKLLVEYGIRDEVMHSKATYWFSSQILVDFVVKPVPNESGMKAYQDIVDLNMLIWLAAAMGEEFSVIREAVQKANKENNLLWKCNRFREAVPFERFHELLDIKIDEFIAAHPEAYEDDQDEE